MIKVVFGEKNIRLQCFSKRFLSAEENISSEVCAEITVPTNEFSSISIIVPSTQSFDWVKSGEIRILSPNDIIMELYCIIKLAGNAV